jgi:hypothetical protein
MVKIVRDNDYTIVKDTRRAYQLSNKDIVQVNDMLLEFEDNMLYEVEIVVYGGIYVVYARTGKSYTPEEINKIVVDNHNK